MNQICQKEKMPMFLLSYLAKHSSIVFVTILDSCIENTKKIDATKVINERQKLIEIVMKI